MKWIGPIIAAALIWWAYSERAREQHQADLEEVIEQLNQEGEPITAENIQKGMEDIARQRADDAARDW